MTFSGDYRTLRPNWPQRNAERRRETPINLSRPSPLKRFQECAASAERDVELLREIMSRI